MTELFQKRLKGLEKELGLKRIPCEQTMCTEGLWPDGGECSDCDGLGYILERTD